MNRGQSEVLGYVFVFSLIVGSVALVYTVGYPSLQDAREASATENVERAFDVLDQNLGDIQHRGAPSRATEVRIAGGRIGFGDPTIVTVVASKKGDPLVNKSLTIETRPIVYQDSAGRMVTFEHGAIVRGNGSHSTFADGVDWTISRERTVISLASVDVGRSTASIAGDSTILVILQRTGTSVPIYFEPDTGTVVNVTVTSNRAGAWQQYFEAQNRTYAGGIDVDDDASDGTVYWEFETDRAYVGRTGISARLAS